MTKIIGITAAAVIGVSLVACNGSLEKQSKLENATKSFGDVVSTGTSTLQTEISSKPAVRRGEALQRFLINPYDETNFTLGGDKRAFANFVCAGTGALQKERAFLQFARAYATGAQGIVKPGGNTFAEQWKKYKELQKPAGQSKSDGSDQQAKTASNLYQACTAELLGDKGLLGFEGVPATDTTDEFAIAAVPAAIAAFDALFNALEKAATDGLTVVNEIEARQKFSAYVKDMHQRFQGSLSESFSPDRIKDAWSRRKAYSLWAPYLTFSHILEMKRHHASDFEIKEVAIKLPAELAQYDAMRATESPDAIVKALSAAEQAVFDAATNEKISLDAVAEFLSGLASDVSSMKSDYEAIQKDIGTAQATTAALIK